MSLPFADAIEKLEFEQITHFISGLTSSSLGKENILELYPSTIPAEIRDELNRVKEMQGLLEAEDSPPIDMIEDCRAAIHRSAIEGSLIASEDFRKIHFVLSTLRKLRTFFIKREERAPLLFALGEQLYEDKMLEYHIDRVVDEEGTIKDSASKELRVIRQEIIEKSGHLRRRMESILKRASDEDMVMEELVTMRDGRMVLPVRAEYKRQVQGFIHSSSASGQTVYIEPTETLELNNEIRDLQFAEVREVNRILTDLTNKLRPAGPLILLSITLYAEIDSLYARARYARDTFGCSPAVTAASPLRLYHAKHPILLMHKKYAEVIPLDITLEPPGTTIVITGPNAGGKSVTMKTVGLLALMAQSGIPVPCDPRSELPIYSDIFVDIGDEQSVENDLSTFSSHVKRLQHITENAGMHSLVLIDEIGTGTDPSEGSALGAAVLEFLTQRKAHVIATTHHGFLKAFAHEQPGMQNAAMEFDIASLEPTYRFKAGLPGSSYAFEITQRHGLREAIIVRAREILGSQSQALENLLADLERKTIASETQLRMSDLLKEKYEALAAEYAEKMTTAKKEANSIKQEALEHADSLLREANSLIENLVRELREKNADRTVIKAAQDQLHESRSEIIRELDEYREAESVTGEPNRRFRSGDSVYQTTNPNLTGIVVEDQRTDHVTVAFGNMKMKLDAHNLRFVEQKQERVYVATQMMDLPDTNEIDIRGMYGDEAVKELDSFLYQAYLAGLKRIDIIHGKGTGALRKRVHEYLKDLPFIAKYQLGEWNEGGSGCTRVIFKDT
jgi:DNA mismatch repair protein MutS2